MSSKYAKPLQVPTEFPDVLRHFTREVLRLQGKVETKEQLYEFASQYFQGLVVKRDGAGAAHAAVAGSAGVVPQYLKLSEDELHALLVRTFQDLDHEQRGVVTVEQLQQALTHIGEALQLSAVELKALFAEADESDDGLIAYGDFVPLAFQATLQLRATRPQRLVRTELFATKDTEILLHGMQQDEFESVLREIFQRADADDTGALSRLAFTDCIRDADMGLSRREVNALLSEAPTLDDDVSRVAYGDFVPRCFPVLSDVFVQGVMELPSDQDALAQYLVEVFASGDADGTGLLPVAELARLFRAADIGLTRLQIATLLAEATADAAGFVTYEKYAAHVAGMALVLASFDSQQTFAPYLLKYRKTSEFYTVLDLNQHAFEQTLSRALEALDESHRGLLPRADVADALSNAFQEISPRQLRCLLALAEPDEMGDVEYHLITHSAFQALQKLQEYDMMIMES